MKKKLLALITLPLALTLAACGKKESEEPHVDPAPPADVEPEYSYADYKYSVAIEDLVVSNEGVLEIPEELDGKPVISIKADAFKGREDIKKVVLPDTIVSIGSSAFAGCSELTEMNIPKSVKAVAYNAFEGSDKLELKVDQSYNDWKAAYKGLLSDDSVQCKTYTYNIMNKGAVEVEFGYSVPLSAAVIEGHSIKEWLVSEIGGEKEEVISGDHGDFLFTYHRNIAIEAVYSANKYNIQFSDIPEQETGLNSIVATYGETPKPVPVPTRKGYSFGGYYYEKEDMSGFELLYNEHGYPVSTFMFTHDIMVFAAWDENLYTITFDTKGGSYFEDTKEVFFGGNFDLEEASRTHYDFMWWKCGDEVFNAYSTYTWEFDEDKTFEAVWGPHTFDVDLVDLGGGELPAEVPTHYEFSYGEPYELPVPTKEGYDFVRWGINYSTYDYTKGIWHYDEDYEFKAVWTPHKYTITYANVSTEKIKVTYDYSAIEEESVEKTFTYAEKIDFAPAYDSETKMFEGWYLDSELSVKVTTSTSFKEDTTLYSKWIDKPTAYSFEHINAYEFAYPTSKQVSINYGADSSTPVTIAVKAHESGTHYIYHAKPSYNYDAYYISVYNLTTSTLISGYSYHNSYYTDYIDFTCSENDVILIKFYAEDEATTVNLYFGDFAEPIIKPFAGYDVKNGVKTAKVALGEYYTLDKQYQVGKTFVGYYDNPNGTGDPLTNANGVSYAAWAGTEDITVYPIFSDL